MKVVEHLTEEDIRIARKYNLEVHKLCLGMTLEDIVEDPVIPVKIFTLLEDNNYFKGNEKFQNLVNYFNYTDATDKRFSIKKSIISLNGLGADRSFSKRILFDDVDDFIKGHNRLVHDTIPTKFPPFVIDELCAGDLLINFTGPVYVKYGIGMKGNSLALLLKIGDSFSIGGNEEKTYKRTHSHYAIRIFVDEIIHRGVSYKGALGLV